MLRGSTKMVLKRWAGASGWLLLSACAAGQQVQTTPQTLTDQQAFCNYQTEQAKAQSDQLRTPSVLGAFTQPETGLPQQIVGGATLSLSNVKKAAITVDAAQKNCVLYSATTAAQQSLQFALPSLEREALTHRLELIATASAGLDELIAKSQKMVDAQNMTRPMVWELQTNRIKLDADRADTQTKIAAIYVPSLSAQPLKTLVAAKQASDLSEQAALDKLTRQSNWDVAFTVGAHQQINPVAGQTVQPYGEITATYNLGSRAVDRHLDRAVSAYGSWKQLQEGDVARSLEVLRQQVMQNISVQEARLKALQSENAQIEKNLQVVRDGDTTAALDFFNQLKSAELMLNIESGDAAFRLARLRQFLAENY